MKKLAVLFLVVFVAGCGTGTFESTPRSTVYYGFDFTKYTAEGFLITPESYNDDYESIGLLNVTIYPAITVSEDNTNYYYNKYNYAAESINPAEVIDSLVTRAKKMGADAIINFKVELDEISYYLDYNIITASGFAIKRK